MAKKLFIKVIVALLLLSVLLTLAACGDDSTTTKKPSTTVPDGPSDDNDDDGPDASFPSQLNGLFDPEKETELFFLYVEGGNGTYTADSIWIDDSADGVILDDVDNAIINRNNLIKEKTGIKISPFDAGAVGISGLQEFARTYFEIQSDEIDVYCGYQYYDIGAAANGWLLDLNTIVNPATGSKIINTEASYWATNYINSITYNDKLYWVTGDVALRYTGGLYCTYVNTSIYDSLVKSAYGGRTIYNIVNAGEWTMDTMLEMAALGYVDRSDGDNIASEGDQFGIVYELCDVIDGMAFGCNVQFSNKVRNNDGTDEISIVLGTNPSASEFASKLNEMYQATYTYNAGNSDSTLMMPIFADGDALFAINKIYMAGVYLSDMEDFAIIPTPMLNASQAKTGGYSTGVHDSVTIFGVSKYSSNPIAAAAALELMSFYGSTVVTPVFYNTVMKGRFVRDDEAAAMIDLIRDGFDSDFVAAWSWSISDVVQCFRNETTVRSFTRYVQAQNRTFTSKLEDLLEKLEVAGEL